MWLRFISPIHFAARDNRSANRRLRSCAGRGWHESRAPPVPCPSLGGDGSLGPLSAFLWLPFYRCRIWGAEVPPGQGGGRMRMEPSIPSQGRVRTDVGPCWFLGTVGILPPTRVENAKPPGHLPAWAQAALGLAEGPRLSTGHPWAAGRSGPLGAPGACGQGPQPFCPPPLPFLRGPRTCPWYRPSPPGSQRPASSRGE